jgi:rubrerythrin
MENSSLTASAIISFSERLESDSEAFYEKLAKKFENCEKVFLGFALESRKNKTYLVRTYQETISDALEASFSFDDLELTDFAFETMLAKATSLNDALEASLELEEKTSTLYTHIAEKSKSLLATIPGAFSRVAKKRKSRISVLQSMLDKS